MLRGLPSIMQVRIWINSLILFVFAFFAHLIAGGTFVNGKKLIAESAGILVLLVIAGEDELTGPKLALISLLTQSTTHLTLGAMSGSGTAMMISHTAGGFLSYFLISKAEKFWCALTKFVSVILKSYQPIEIFISKGEIRLFSHGSIVWDSKLFSRSNGLRAPPAFYAI